MYFAMTVLVMVKCCGQFMILVLNVLSDQVLPQLAKKCEGNKLAIVSLEQLLQFLK